ncbi:hypothetical protein D3C84_641370 [compost metagenome]
MHHHRRQLTHDNQGSAPAVTEEQIKGHRSITWLRRAHDAVAEHRLMLRNTQHLALAQVVRHQQFVHTKTL